MSFRLVGKPSLRRKIILPFLVLLLFVGAVGSAVLSAQVSSSAQSQFDSYLSTIASRANDRIAAVESDRLQQLRAATGSTGIDLAIKRGDALTSARLLLPIVGNAQPEHLVLRVVTEGGKPLLNVRRDATGVSTFFDNVNLAGQPAVTKALAGMTDSHGDKYVLLSSEPQTIVYWVGPVRLQSDPTQVVGAILVGQSLAEITQSVRGSAGVDVAFYNTAGGVLTSSLSGVGPLATDARHQLDANTPVRIFTTIGAHRYGFVVSEWTMRGTRLGYVAVAADADPLENPLAAVDVVLAILFAGAALAALVMGLVLSDRITRPIEQLVSSMRVVAAGNFGNRVPVQSLDEIGFLAKTFNEMAAALQQQRREREESYFRSLEALARAIDARDPYTFEHSSRVAAISEILATAMGLPAQDIVDLRRGGLLHDVGKIGVPDQILAKTAPLTDAEWAIIRRHPIIGHDMLKDVPFLGGSLAAVRHHHERWDGEGYPDKLAGTNIVMLARIVSVADSFDAMTSDRPYRKGFSFQFAARTIASEAGKQFDPDVVKVFTDNQERIFTRLEELGKKPTPHASDIRLDEAA